MNIRVLPADELTPDQLAAWDAIQRAEPALASPYFRPEFTQAVSAVRGGVEVGIVEEKDACVGFFPFQRGRRDVGFPVGGRMSDFQGVIVRSDVAWEPKELLEGCRLRAWHFDHLIASQTPFQPHHWNVAPSPYIDLSSGWEGYQAEQLAHRRNSFKAKQRKRRQAAQEAGPLRAEHGCENPKVLKAMMKWKIEQYRRTGVVNVLGFDWTASLLERILAAKGEAFSGLMSALYMGNVLTAVLFSMRSRDVVHGWFSAYRPNFAPLSPGTVLWLEILQSYPDLDVRRIDLGKGPESYKKDLMSGATDVAEGSVDMRPLLRTARRCWHNAYDCVRRSPLKQHLLGPGRMIRNLVEARGFRP